MNRSPFRTPFVRLVLAGVLLLGAFTALACGKATVSETLASSVPFFPWPPPQASTSEEIPPRLLEGKTHPKRLGDIDRRLTAALEANGYYESSYYAVPKGFALVTRMEQIEPDGSSKATEARWNQAPQPLGHFSLNEYLHALFQASPGYYRVLVFVVTPVAFTQTEAKVTPEEANKWLGGGLNRLPPSLADAPYASEEHRCTALVYEFERASKFDEEGLKIPGRLPGRTHLLKSGIWGGLER